MRFQIGILPQKYTAIEPGPNDELRRTQSVCRNGKKRLEAAMPTDATGPTIEALRALLLFAEKGESKTVGSLLGVHASGISRRLRLFQKAGLMKKVGSGLALTVRGREALPALRGLLRQYDQLSRWLKEPAREQPQALVVATGAAGAAYYLPPVLALLRKWLPSCAVRVQVCRGRDRIRGVADGSFDLAIVSHDADQVRTPIGATETETSLEFEELAHHSLCLLARQQTEAAETLRQLPVEQTVPLVWLARFELIGLDPRSGLRRQLERVRPAKLVAASTVQKASGVGASYRIG